VYCFLSTLRIHESSAGRSLVVGPKRRVLFGRGVLLRGRGKSAIKEALKPLAGYWSRPSDSDHKPGSHIQADVPVMGFLKKNLRKGEVDAVVEAFNSPEVEMLPPGSTTWRMSNAISWIANTKVEDEGRKLEVMKVAGAMLDGKTGQVIEDAA